MKNENGMLPCGCRVSEGKFIIGHNCKANNCRECLAMPTIHPFGRGRYAEMKLKDMGDDL